jgi:hypothetical protein
MTKMNNAVEQVRSKGRYGDTELMHVNPIEVEWMHKNLPGGLTRNPDTGQPEAFLPLLMAMAGSWGAGAMGLGTLMGTSALTAGAVGAGAGSFAGNMLQGESFGDSLKSGLTSGALSFGLGSLGDAVTGANPAGEAGLLADQGAAGLEAAQAADPALAEGLTQSNLEAVRTNALSDLDLTGANTMPNIAQQPAYDAAFNAGATRPSWDTIGNSLKGGLKSPEKFLSGVGDHFAANPEGALALGAGAVGVGLGGLDSAMGPQYEAAEREKKQRGPWIEEQFPAERQRMTPGADYRPGIDPEFQFFSPVGRQRNVAGGGLMNIPRRGGMEGALRRFARGGLLRNFALGGAVRQRNLLPQGFQHGLNSEFNFFKPVTHMPGVGLMPSIPGHNPTVAPANMGLAPASTIHQIIDDGQGGQLGPPGAPLGAEAANDPVGPVGVPGAMGPVGNSTKGPPAPTNEFSVTDVLANNPALAAVPGLGIPVGLASLFQAKTTAEKSAERAAQISKQATKEQPYKSEFNPPLSPPPLTAEETAEAAADAAASAAAASGGASGTDAPTGAPDMGHGDPDMGDEDSPDRSDGDPSGDDGDPSGGEGSGGGLD